jgi:NAD+ synthase
MQRIKLPGMNCHKAAAEIGDFVVRTVENGHKTGCVIGLSGGVDSTVTVALVDQAFLSTDLEVVGYILPTKLNGSDETKTGIQVAKKLGIKYHVENLDKLVKAYRKFMPRIRHDERHEGNMISRIRANVLNTYAALEDKVVCGTGNKDEDYGIGYYTLFGDGAVHMNPIGRLSKRLVKQMAEHLGFHDIARKTPTAGLEPGQTDFKDLGYDYDLVELVIEGHKQGIELNDFEEHHQIKPLARQQMRQYVELFGRSQHYTVRQVVEDILRRHKGAQRKGEIIHPPTAPVSLKYE